MVLYGSFFSFHGNFYAVWENCLRLCPLLQDFDEITPLILAGKYRDIIKFSMAVFTVVFFKNGFAIEDWRLILIFSRILVLI
jgi:hypothetical protein